MGNINVDKSVLVASRRARWQRRRLAWHMRTVLLVGFGFLVGSIVRNTQHHTELRQVISDLENRQQRTERQLYELRVETGKLKHEDIEMDVELPNIPADIDVFFPRPPAA